MQLSLIETALRRPYAHSGIRSCPHCFSVLLANETHACAPRACQLCGLLDRETQAECCGRAVCRACRVTVGGQSCCGNLECVRILSRSQASGAPPADAMTRTHSTL
jgi:hypothetical protein